MILPDILVASLLKRQRKSGTMWTSLSVISFGKSGGITKFVFQMLHEDYFAFLTNYFSNSKVDQAERLLECMSMRMESLLSLLAVVLAVLLSDFVSGHYDVHRPDNCLSYIRTFLAIYIYSSYRLQ